MHVELRNLLVEDALPAVLVTLNRPEQRNALSTPLMQELTEELDRQSVRPEARAIILRATGPAFSAGHDLNELVDRTLEEEQEIFAVCTRLMETIQRIPQPVIAAVQGIATAAGCQLVATCDLAIASDAARFATSGIDNGLFCSTPMVALSRNVPRKQAMEMLMTGEMISAERAREIGLVNHVVPAGHERDAAIALAQKIARKSAYAIRLGKQAFYKQVGMDLADAYRLTAEIMTENMMAFDAIEGIGAFIEKREPKWQDK